MRKCPRCGRPNEEGPDAGRFCEYCGYDLGAGPVTALTPPTPGEKSERQPSAPMTVQGRNYRTPFAIAVIVLLAVAALSGFTYLQSSTRTATITATTTTATTAATATVVLATVVATYTTTIIPSTNSTIRNYQNIIDLNDSEPIRLSDGQFKGNFSFGYSCEYCISLVSYFKANYSGYIIVSYSSVSAPAEEGIQVTETPMNSSYGWTLFGSGHVAGTQLYPLVPGWVSVIFRATSQCCGADVATLSVTYYY